MLAQFFAVVARLSDTPVLYRKESSNFFLGLVAPPFYYHIWMRILTGRREPVTRVDLDIFGLKTLNNGSARE